jgi:hypothetical protein
MVYYELDRCPECGLDFYPPDDEEEEEPGFSRAGGRGRSLAAVVLGWLVSSMTAFALFYVSRTILPPATGWQAQSLLFVTGAAFIGGYVATAIAKRQSALDGILVGVLSIVNAILIETLWRDITTEPLIRPMTLLAWGLIVVGGVGGAVTSMQLQQRAAGTQLIEDEESLYQDLMVRVRHDQGVADRLIAFERQRAPSASRAELIRGAIDRWKRDNR